MAETNIITLETVIQRNDTKFLSNPLGEEMVMMNMENGDFISMNKVGADIWNLTGEKITINGLIQRLMAIYDINLAQCTDETVQFLKSSQLQNMFIIYNENND
jgi:hypothetical protein